MKLEDILQLDCSDKANLAKLRKALTKTPFFEDWTLDKIQIEHLESAILKMQRKYPISISYIMLGPPNDKNQPFYYTMPIKSTTNHEWLKSVYGISVFELYAKAIIFMFSYIKNKLRKEMQ